MTCSWVTVACALLIGLWTVPQLVATGTVGVGGSVLFELLYLFPALIGVPVSLLGAVVAVTLALRRTLTSAAERLLATGQLLSVLLTALCAVALTVTAASGWELVATPLAFQTGQVVVVVGLVLLVRRR